MSVTFTSNIGLAKPTESEIAEKWVNIDQLQADNLTLMNTHSNIVVTSYTPAIIGQSGNPTVGAGGQLRGDYVDIEGIIFGNAVVAFDTGLTVGSNEYGISLPFEVDGSFHFVGTALNNSPGSFSVIGEGYAFDASNVNASGSLAIDAVTIAGVSYARMITEAYTHITKTVRVVTAGEPFGPAVGDAYCINYVYKRV